MILDPLNVFFLGILVLRKDTDVTHLLFGIVSLLLMSHLMNLSPISLLRLLVTILLLVSLLPTVSPIESPQKPLQVYCRRQKPPTETSTPPSDPTPDPASLPIALRKGKRSCTFHPISQFVSYGHLSPSFCAFTTSLNYTVVPKSVQEAMSISGWKSAMEAECLPCLKKLLGL